MLTKIKKRRFEDTQQTLNNSNINKKKFHTYIFISNYFEEVYTYLKKKQLKKKNLKLKNK